ncbi:MAG: GGDEF domain-containing protein [Hahellaceae bacterium]|jgi:diguanylate cyclase (GGDEF)-like protein|nr:GGDEF domain-containing protein [Hahellaceae bacterium]
MDDKFSKTMIQKSEAYEDSLVAAVEAPACFVLLLGEKALVGRQWSIDSGSMIIGRSSFCQISIDDLSVSARHAQISSTDDGDTIVDLGSTNKTLINGTELKINTPYKLRNNDLIKMGNIIVKYLARGNIESVSVAETFDRSYTDALTRVYNKGALALQGMEFFEKAMLQNLPLGIASLDIDFFKKVNDNHGHAAGDFVLVEFARLVKEKYRSKDDFLARAGGEEFILMISRRQLPQAIVQLESLRKAVDGHRFEFKGVHIPVTVSIGFAMMTNRDKNWQNILERSDKALYRSKAEGRNRLTVI